LTDLDQVLVLAGGLSAEREVSLRSGQRVADALRGIGTDVLVRDLDAGLMPALAELPATVVFPVLHGIAG
jgi:D-alanine-D-alanine ligase